MNKNIVIGFLVVIVLVGGYFILKPKNTAPVATAITPSEQTNTSSITSNTAPQPSTPSDQTQSSTSVAGMQQYTDKTFGFSFWYPNTWQVTTPTNLAFGAQIKGATVVAKLGVQPIGQSSPSILIQEVHSTDRSMTDTGGAGPIGPVTYFFNASAHLWMTTDANGITSPADISANTIGGLHMFPGTSRFDTTIIPLSADNFVVIGDAGDVNATPLSKTVIALDPSVATPVSNTQQAQTIQEEETSIQSSSDTTNSNTSLQTYANQNLGFQIQYPTSAQIKDQGELGGAGGQEIAVSIPNAVSPFTRIDVQTKDAQNGVIVPAQCNPENLPSSSVTFNGISFIKTDVSTDFSGMESGGIAQAYCVMNNGTRYTITTEMSYEYHTSTPAPDTAVYFPQFDQLVNSLGFKFI